MKTLQQHRAAATLAKVFRYPEGIMSRSEWLKYWHIKGATVEEVQVPKIEYNRLKFNRLEGAAQDEYWAKCQEKKQGYSLRLLDGCSYDLTKTEYEYFKGMQLAEDKATEAMELTYKIEAGTATNEEIEEDEQREFEFFNKYCND